MWCCVIICILKSLLIPTLGHELYFGNFNPWHAPPGNNWNKWKNPNVYDDSRGYHNFGNGYPNQNHFGSFAGAHEARATEREQNGFDFSGRIREQHPFGFFGAQLTRNSGKDQNEFAESGFPHSFENFESQDPKKTERGINYKENSDRSSADYPQDENTNTGFTFIDTGHFPFSPLDVESHPTDVTESNSQEDKDIESNDYFHGDNKEELQNSSQNIGAENSVEQCTIDDELGTCLNIDLCPRMLKLLKEQPIKQSTISYLTKIGCGFDNKIPKVCCPMHHSERMGGQTDEQVPPPDVSSHPNLSLLPTDCGQFDEPRILGGQRAALFEFPWMVLIAYKSTLGGIKLSCGGTLISSRYVLTAAHCVTNLTRLTLAGVVLGDLDIQTDPDCENIDGETVCAPPAQNVTIEEVISHPDYNTKLHNDIALIRLKEPADFQQDNIRPICLPLTNNFQTKDLTGSNVTVIGWGATESGLQSPHLLRVALPVVSNEECANIYKSSRSATIWYKQICAGGERDRDSCGGDSGGPLVYPGLFKRQLRYIQRGIVSFGLKQCGNGGYPGVYTRVAYYVDWILDNIRP